MTDHFVQDVRCKKCQKLLGYAPYQRDAYLCIECNGPITEDDINEYDL